MYIFRAIGHYRTGIYLMASNNYTRAALLASPSFISRFGSSMPPSENIVSSDHDEYLSKVSQFPLTHYACWKCQGRGVKYRRIPINNGSSKQKKANQKEGESTESDEESKCVPNKASSGSLTDHRIVTETCGVCGSTGLLPVKKYLKYYEEKVEEYIRHELEEAERQSREPTAAELAEREKEQQLQRKLVKKALRKAQFDCKCRCKCKVHHSCETSSNSSRKTHNPLSPQSGRMPRIAISGSGIAGSALALALQQRGIPCVVYERDSHFDVRRQGYGLTMQQGALALSHLGLAVEGVASDSHFSFSPEGRILGCYGHGLISTENKKRRNIREARSLTAPSSDQSVKGGESSPSAPSTSSQNVGVANNSRIQRSDVIVTQKTRFNTHLPRQRLRHALISSLEPDTIQWGAGVTKILPNPYKVGSNSDANISSNLETSKTHLNDDDELSPLDRVYFELSDGRADWADIFIAADGVRSHSRSLKIGDSLKFLGFMVVLGYAPTVHPLLRRRVCQTLDGVSRIYSMPFTGTHSPINPDTKFIPESERENNPIADEIDFEQLAAESALSSSQNLGSAAVRHTLQQQQENNGQDVALAGDTTMWQISWPCTEAEATLLAKQGPKALLDECKRRVGHWHTPVPQLLHHTPVGCVTGYPTYDRDPVPLEIFRNGTKTDVEDRDSLNLHRITLIGDAAHPMSPFKGQGANQALLDAISLAIHIRDSSPVVRELQTDQSATFSSFHDWPVLRAPPAHTKPLPYTVAIEKALGELPCTCNTSESSTVQQKPLHNSGDFDDDGCSANKRPKMEQRGVPNGKSKEENTTPLQDNKGCSCECEMHRSLLTSAFVSESYDRPIEHVLQAFEAQMATRTNAKVLESRANAGFLHTEAAMAVGNCPRSHAAANQLGKREMPEWQRSEGSTTLSTSDYQEAVLTAQQLLDSPVYSQFQY